MNFESTLRESLRAGSSHAPTSEGLLGAVEARSSRRRQRRQVAGAGIAVAAVIGVALVATTAAGAMNAPSAVPGPVPPAATGTAPPPPETPAASVPLVPAPDLDLPDFPFTPGWTPPGVPGPYYHHEDFGEPSEGLRSYISALLYYDPATGSAGGPLWSVEVSDQPYARVLDKLEIQFGDFDEDEPAVEPPTPPTRQAVTVRGKDAELLSNPSTAYLTWQHSDEQWVMVSGGPAVDVIQYAEDLVEQPYPGRSPFAFDLLPDGVELRRTDPHAVMFWPSTPVPGGGFDGVEVTLLQGAPGMSLNCPLSRDPGGYIWDDSYVCPLPRTPVQVGENAGEQVGDHMVVVYLPDGLALQVETAGALALAGEDLLQFAAGIQVTPDAKPRA